MKKIYCFALAALTATSAFAAGRTNSVVKVNPAMPVQEQKVVLSNTMAKAPESGFSSVAKVEGEYTWNYYGLLNGDSGDQVGVVTLTVTDAATGEVTIEGIFSAGTGIKGKIKGTVDLEEGTLTLANRQSLGTDSYGDANYFYFKELDDDGYLLDGPSEVESVEASIEGKSFYFPEVYVFAVGDPDDENLGWWKLTAFNEFVEYAEPDDLIDLDEWTKFSTATMEDGWVIPGLKYNDGTYADPAEFPLNVDVYQNNEDENLYAIVNPYMPTSGFPMSSGQVGYIVFDLTDPTYVLVNPGVFSGYMNGSSRIHCFNLEGFYAAEGYDKETVQAALEGEVTEWSNAVSDETSTTVTIPTCRFNFPGAEDKAYSWTNRADAMKAKIVINSSMVGVKATAVEETQVPVVFYNLQGVRVDNPNAGVYIKCEGTKTTKVVVK